MTRRLHLGYDALKRPIHLDPSDRKSHMHVIGSSGSGKSKFLEWMIRGDLRNHQGFCLLDPHGTLYDEVVKYCAHYPTTLPRDIIQSREIRQRMIDNCSVPLVQREWEELQDLKARDWREETLSLRNRLFRFLSSPSLMRFMGLADRSLDLKEIMDSGKILLVNLAPSDELSEENARVFGALLVNEFFECARRRQKDSRDNDPKPYYLYIDEFQEFVSIDVSKMLDQVRKYGLFAILSHQRFGQLNDDLIDSLSNCKIKAVFGGLPAKWARYMAEELFIGKLDPKKIKVAIKQTKFWPKEERRQVYTHGTSHSTSVGESSGSVSSSVSGSSFGEFFGPEQWCGSMGSSRGSSSAMSESSSYGSSYSESETTSESVADIPVFVPVPFEELSSIQYYSIDEQLTELTAALKEQYARHCFIKIQGNDAEPMLVPKVEQPYTRASAIAAYQERRLAAANALPAEAVDQLLAEQEKRLIEGPDTDGPTIPPSEPDSNPPPNDGGSQAPPPRSKLFDDLLGNG